MLLVRVVLCALLLLLDVGADAYTTADPPVMETSTSGASTTPAAAEAARQEWESPDYLDIIAPRHNNSSMRVLLYLAGVLVLVVGAFTGAAYLSPSLSPGACTYDNVEPCMAAYSQFFKGNKELTGMRLAVRQVVWIVQDIWSPRATIQLPKTQEAVEELLRKLPRLPADLYEQYRKQAVGVDPGSDNVGAGASAYPAEAAEARGEPSSNATAVPAAAGEGGAAVQPVAVEAPVQVAEPAAALQIDGIPADVTSGAAAEQHADLSASVDEIVAPEVVSPTVPNASADGVLAAAAAAQEPSDSITAVSAVELLDQPEETLAAPTAAEASSGDKLPALTTDAAAEPQQEQGICGYAVDSEVVGERTGDGGIAEQEVGMVVGDGSPEMVWNGVAAAVQDAAAGEGAADQLTQQQEVGSAAEGGVELGGSGEGEKDALSEQASPSNAVAEEPVVRDGHREEAAASQQDAEEHTLTTTEAADAEVVSKVEAAAAEKSTAPAAGAEAALGLEPATTWDANVDSDRSSQPADQGQASAAAGAVASGSIAAMDSPDAIPAPEEPLLEPPAAADADTATGIEAVDEIAAQQLPEAGSVQTSETTETARAEPIASADEAETAAVQVASSSESAAAADDSAQAALAAAHGPAAEAAASEDIATGADAGGAALLQESELVLSDISAAAEDLFVEPLPSANVSSAAVADEIIMPDAEPLVEAAVAKVPKPRKV